MNGKLVLLLSLFGLAMGLGTVFFIRPNIEPICWVVVLFLSAYIIGRSRTEKPFRAGFLLGLANCVWIVASHALFAERYLAGHPQEAGMLKSMPGFSPRVAMMVTGPIAGIVSGIIIGLLSMLAAKLFRRPRLTLG